MFIARQPFAIILCLIIAAQSTHSRPFEFGELSNKDLDLERYREKYPEDHAVMIGDIGECRFVYNNNTQRFQFEFQRTFRLMVLNESGGYLGDFSIPYYATDENSESVSRFRAHVYNPGGRRPDRDRVRQRDGYTEHVKGNWHELKFAFPNIKPGSVIEVRYTITSDFLRHLRDWQFQYEFPVEHSEFSLRLLSIFSYRMYYRGLIDLDESESWNVVENIRVNRSASVYGSAVDAGHLNVDIDATQYRWLAEDIPAFREEPFTDNIANYLALMNFEMVGEQWPDRPANDFTRTWQDVQQSLYQNKRFGGFLNHAMTEVNRFAQPAEESSGDEIMAYALETIRKHIRWNNRSHYLTSELPYVVLESGSGNAAEMNLLLLALLRRHDLDARPVLLSTVEGGHLSYDSPTLQFNYLLVAVNTQDDEYILLDATAPHFPPGYIPPRAINRKGRIITEESSEWIPLINPELPKTVKHYELTLEEDGSLTGTMEYAYHDYARHLLLGELAYRDEEWVLDRTRQRVEAELESFELILPEADNESLVKKASIAVEPAQSQVPGEIYLDPLLFESLRENQFRRDERHYPIYFGQRSQTVITINLQFPESLSLDHIPEDYEVKWRNELLYTFSAEKIADNTLQISASTIISTPVVEASYYRQVKEFFDRIVNQNMEQLVFIQNQ